MNQIAVKSIHPLFTPIISKAAVHYQKHYVKRGIPGLCCYRHHLEQATGCNSKNPKSQ